MMITARKRNTLFIGVGMVALHTLTSFCGSKSILRRSRLCETKPIALPERRKAMQKLQTVNADTLLYGVKSLPAN